MDASVGDGSVAADEDSHPAGDGPWWAERWWFGWWQAGAPDGLPAGFVELVLLPNQRRSWYRCALVREGQPLLVLVDHDAPLPRVGLELRTDGLWADHNVEAPFQQWTVANEAFALAVDDADDVVGRGHGTSHPLALDVEWYASDRPMRRDPTGGVDGYGQAGEVEGVAELGGGRSLPFTARSWRTHEWGPLLLPPVGDDGPGRRRVTHRWPAPFDVVVDDVVTARGWERRRR